MCPVKIIKTEIFISEIVISTIIIYHMKRQPTKWFCFNLEHLENTRKAKHILYIPYRKIIAA